MFTKYTTNDSLNTLNESIIYYEKLDYPSLIEDSEENFNYSINPILELNLNQENHPNFVSAFIPEFFTLLKILDILNLSKNEELKDRIKSVFTQKKEFINENKDYCIENTKDYNYMKLLGKKKVRIDDMINIKQII